VVWEGWHREVSPYPDPCPTSAIPKYARIGAGVWKADIEGGQKQTNVAPP